jgi:hypothetical protein
MAVGTDSFPGAPPLRIAKSAPGAVAVGAGGTPGAPAQPVARDVPQPAVPFEFAMMVPASAQLGKEFDVTLSVPATADMQSGQAQIRYDPAVLQFLGPVATVPGLAAVTFDGQAPMRSLRFRVIAKVPTTTRIAVESAEVVDRSGFAAGVTLPAAVDLALAQ